MFKRKEEKELEREIKIRRAKNFLENYIVKLENLQKRIFNTGKEYSKLGDEISMRNQAKKYLYLENKIKEAKKIMLLMEEADIQREFVKLSGLFVEFSKNTVESIAAFSPKIKDIIKSQVKFGEAMKNVEEIEEALNTVVDAVSEGILSGKEVSNEKIREVEKLFEGELIAEESEMDKKIDEEIKNIEEKMKKG